MEKLFSCRTSKDKNKVMASASNIQWCEPCGRAGENQQAHSWWSDCSEPLCGECLKFHTRGKTTAIHKTIPILEAKKLFNGFGYSRYLSYS